MLKYDVSKPLFSLHVPKTGGTTLCAMLPMWYPPGSILFHYRRPGNVPPRKYLLESGDIVHGHFINGDQSGLLDYYPDAQQCVAFVRHPLKRLVSHYFQEQEEVHERGAPLMFQSFVDYYLTTVANQKEHGPIMGALNCLPSTLTIDNYQDVINGLFVHLGLYEEFTDSVAIMRAKLADASFQYDAVEIDLPRTRSPERKEDIPRTIIERYETSDDFALEKAIWLYSKNLHEQELSTWR